MACLSATISDVLDLFYPHKRHFLKLIEKTEWNWKGEKHMANVIIKNSVNEEKVIVADSRHVVDKSTIKTGKQICWVSSNLTL